MMNKENFTLGNGRKRPQYQPQTIQCPHCGGGSIKKDERTQLIVCAHCGSRLDVSGAEAKVLSAGKQQRHKFPFELGSSFRWKGIRYEFTARLVYNDEGEPDEITREYLLYNPFHGSLWLSEYNNRFSLSGPTHVMPRNDPFSRHAGSGKLKTYDNQVWICDETGTYELTYVDGALPWIAEKGDKIHYAEYHLKSTPSRHYEAQKIKDEIEFSIGDDISLAQVRKATGLDQVTMRKEEKGKTGDEEAFFYGRNGSWDYSKLFLVVIALIVGIAFFVYVSPGSGRYGNSVRSGSYGTSRSFSGGGFSGGK